MKLEHLSDPPHYSRVTQTPTRGSIWTYSPYSFSVCSIPPVWNVFLSICQSSEKALTGSGESIDILLISHRSGFGFSLSVSLCSARQIYSCSGMMPGSFCSCHPIGISTASKHWAWLFIGCLDRYPDGKNACSGELIVSHPGLITGHAAFSPSWKWTLWVLSFPCSPLNSFLLAPALFVVELTVGGPDPLFKEH